MTYEIIFPNGRSVSAGAPGAAIRSLKRTDSAFDRTELQPGGVCASCMEVEFFDDGLVIQPGDVLALYEDSTLSGTYIAQQPTTPNPGLRRVVAYDFVTKLDTDLTGWLESLTDWPYSLSQFARMVCNACGVTLTGDLANGDWPVSKFQARGITGRQLMQWVCQAGCRFCRAEPDGTLKLGWLQDSHRTLTQRDIFQGSLTLSDYITQAVDGVRVALSATDVGVSHPQNPENPLDIRGNYLLSGCGEAQAQAILEALGDISHTPMTFRTALPLALGERFILQTGQGEFPAVVMTVEQTGPLYTVTSTGAKNRAQSLCTGSFQALSGRVLEHELSLQGVQTRMVEFGETAQRYSQLSQDVDHITAQVGVLDTLTQTNRQNYTQLRLDSEGLSLKLSGLDSRLAQKADGSRLEEMETHFRFDGSGLTISNSATGMGIVLSQEQVAFHGGVDPTTVITPNRMQTTRLQVLDRLDAGNFAFLPRTNGNLSLRAV